MATPRHGERPTVKDSVPHDVTVQNLRATTRKEAITVLLNALVIQGVLPLEKERFVLDSILERERVASTGIGNGIAIPHAKSKFAERFGLAVGLSHEGIDFEAHDGMDAYFIALWVCPPAATAQHLALMRGIASVAQDANASGQLQACRDKRGLLDLLGKIPVG